MSPARRLSDLALVVLVAPLALPLVAVLAVLVRVVDGAPAFHVAERMRSPERAFRLYKLRTMRHGGPGFGPGSGSGSGPGAAGVLGGDRADRVTRLGRVLRRTRLDELPQLWNILRGDMAFVGPRPPERMYVARRPALYARVLRSRPGLTGLATLLFHAREEQLLAACRTAAQTDAVYMRRCVPRKARLDLIWQRHAGVCADLWLLWRTLAAVTGRALRGAQPPGRLPRRRRAPARAPEPVPEPAPEPARERPPGHTPAPDRARPRPDRHRALPRPEGPPDGP